MSKQNFSYDERNEELPEYDSLAGRHGRIRLLLGGKNTCTSKMKQEFFCLDCGAGSNGGWLMLFHNVRYGKGCPICASAQELIEAVATKWSAYRLVVIAKKQGMPNPATILYLVLPVDNPLPNNFQWIFTLLTRAAITSGIRNNERPGRVQDFAYGAATDVYRAWKDAFGDNGSICYAGKEKPGFTSPGPFFAIDTASRIMRPRACEDHISTRGVLEICAQECKDKEKDIAWRLESEPFGATIIGYNYTDTFGVRINYKNRFDLERTDTYYRAIETNWGQTKMRKGESLCFIILSGLFPSNDWQSNSRPEFLTYCVEGKTPSRLELDGYSEDLNLAFEYQGDHHYNTRDASTDSELNLKEIQARDAFKVDVCHKRGITLLVIPEIDLDPELFLKKICEICLDYLGRPIRHDIEIESVWEKWNDWCQNPLADFQDEVVRKLNGHQLISPKKEKIGKNSLVTYECGNCGAENKTLAKQIKDGSPRKACVQCKGQVAGTRRRDAKLDEWKSSSALPADFIANVMANSIVGETRYVCELGHNINVYNLEFANRHVIDGTFVCPECEAENLGVDASLVALQRNWDKSLADDLKLLGLSVFERMSPTNGQATALSSCASSRHQFVVTRNQVSALLRNECLNDLAIVPSACHECCYPGIDRDSASLLRSTVFHRLYILGAMYPQAKYLSGFDPTSWGDEFFSCGETHEDGTRHPPIRISFRNLQKTAKRYPQTHLCVACGLERGQIVGGGKTLNDLVAVMKVMREELGRRIKLPNMLSPPTVELVSGEISDKGEVSATKTRLRFWCGITGHDPVVATKDYYFNRAEARGRGFCSQCVELYGGKKAPLPTASNIRGLLRSCKIREK
ncbi:hypothetical protein ACFQNF_19865 [Iodobacter arcticus]|uniref:Uncharacterized protein n=1 Tax=Iodobacter arcticus TaxID=590593 RepID=A0ABW2R492_9NEIS